MKNKIQMLSKEIIAEAVSMRRHIHSFPELSGKEYKTSDFIREKLQQFGIENIRQIADTGIVATVFGNNCNKKRVALRAEMDALPIYEKNEFSFKSKNDGVMHACGHDVHTANLLAAAWVLNQLKNEFEGTIQFVFQPSEEAMPSGANRMLSEGIFEQRQPDAMIAIHVDPTIPVGKIGFRCGSTSASADECYITVKGKGGHGAYPAQFINPIVIASKIIIELQSLTDLSVPTVVTFGKIEALGKTNVVPEIAKIEGTIRAFDEKRRGEIHQQIRQKAAEIAQSFGGSVDVNILLGYPVLKTDRALTLRCKSYLEDYFDNTCMVESPLRMGADDFSYFSEKYSATLLRLGTRNESKGIVSALHTDTFDVDEDIIKIGIETLCCIALNELKV